VNLLRKASAWLARTHAQSVSDSVIYSRGSTSVRVSAGIGSSNFQFTDSEGFVDHVKTRDFLIRPSELKLDYVPIDPKPGDRIVTDCGDTYEVMAVNGEPCWRWSDPFQSRFRIHASLINQAEIRT
jgi:hypothetical protein